MEDYGVHLTKEEEAKVDQICGKIRERVAKEPMTPRQRFEAIARGEEPDRVPIHMCAIGLHSASNYGVNPSDLYADPKVALFAYLTHLERFGYDTVSTFRFSVGEEEFGGTVAVTDVGVPFTTKGFVETVADLDKIKFPDVRKDGSLPWMLWMLGLLKEKLGDIMPMWGFMPIPGVAAGCPGARGMVESMMDMINNPVLAHALGAAGMKFYIDYGNAQFEAGADALHIVGVDNLISYAQHREFEFPYVCGLLKSVRGPCFIIGADDWSHVLESYAIAGVEGFYLYSGQPLDKAKEVSMKYKLTLRYGVNAQVLVHGPADKIREEVKRVIKQGWPGSHFVLATDALDIATPAEHLDVFMEAAKEYGQLPLKI